jgi:uncharacterized protein with HEPN domain
MKDDTLYLGHIRDAIDAVESYIKGISYNQFVSNKMMTDAVVRELEIIGEAINNLSKDFRSDHPQIPFRDIIDMRNVLIHEYFGVNTKIVWDTCKKNLPALKPLIQNILGERQDL